MNEWLEFVIYAVLIGTGATILMDSWAVFLKRVLGIKSLDYCMLGRWIGHFSHLRFRHNNIGQSEKVGSECLIGWTFHYAIGITFSFLLLVIWGLSWAQQPTLLPALIIGVVTVAAPFFLLQPGMGAGVAASKTPQPNVSRLLSLSAHTAYGIGLYLSAIFLSLLI